MASPIEELTKTHSELTDEIIATSKSDPNKKILRGLRTRLEDKIEEIERLNVNRNTEVFINANRELLAVNGRVQEALDELDDMVAKIDAIRGLLTAITSFLAMIPTG